MAVTVNATGTNQRLNTVSSITYTGITVAAGSNTSLLVYFALGSNATGITATWDSGATNQSMTLVGSATQAGFYTGYLYGLVSPTTGNKNLLISWTNNTEVEACAMAFDGTSNSTVATAFTHFNSSVASTAAPSVVITSATGDMVVAGIVSDDTISAPNNTSIFIDNAGVNTYAEQRAAGAASVTCSWTVATSQPCVTIGCDVVATAAASSPFGASDLSRQWDIVGGPTWPSFFNPNIFTNPVPKNQTDWSKPLRVPKAPFDLSVPLNPNLFKNPVPTLNLYDQAHPFWPSPYRPFPDGLNPNIFKNPVPFNNGDQSSGGKVNPDWAPYPQVGININLQTNSYPVLNQFTPVFGIKNAYPVDQALNINIFTNPVPVQNTYISVKDIVSVPLFEEGYNQNLYTVTVVSVPFLNQVQPSFSLFRSLPQPDVPYNANLLTNPYPVLNLFWAPFQPGPTKPLDPTYNANLYPAPVVALPFNNYFWPPAVTIPNVSPESFNLIPVDNAVPFNQTDWSKPSKPPVALIVDQYYNSNIYSIVVVSNPIVATDIFRPVAVRSSLPLDPIYNPNILTNPYPVQNIFVPVKDIVQAPFFEQPDNPNIYAVVVVNPFVPTDVFTVFVPKTSSVPGIGLNPNISTNPYPFNQFDYPRAKTTPSAQYDLSVILNPNIFLASPIPFAQFDYPLTKRTPQAPIDLSFYFNQNLPPIIPPIVVQPPSGRQWSEKEWNKILQESWVVPDQKTLTDEVKKAAAILSKMGGHARAKALTSKQRTAIASKAASIRWK